VNAEATVSPYHPTSLPCPAFGRATNRSFLNGGSECEDMIDGFVLLPLVRICFLSSDLDQDGGMWHIA